MFAFNPWLKLSLDAVQLGAEAGHVMALRMMKLADGGAGALAEAQLMVAEKMQAAVEAQGALLQGALTGSVHAGPQKAMQVYRRKVRANRRRLAAR